MRNEAESEYEQMCAELDHLRECDKASRKLIAELQAKLESLMTETHRQRSLLGDWCDFYTDKMTDVSANNLYIYTLTALEYEE